MKHKGLWSMAALLVIAAAGFGIWWMKGSTETPVKMNTVAVNQTSLQEKVHTTGTIGSDVRQEIRVLNPSRVQKVNVKAGDQVKKGQVLVQLDSTLADAQAAQAQAALDAARKNREAAQKNVELAQAMQDNQAQVYPSSSSFSVSSEKGGTISSSSSLEQAKIDLAQAQAAVKQAEEGLKVAQAQRNLLILKAAFPGTVLEVNAQEGNQAPMQVPAVVLADLTKMNASMDINEVDASKVKIGQTAYITSKVMGSTILKGTVKKVAPQAVSKLSVQGNTPPTVTAVVSLGKVPVLLKPGYTVNVDILVASKEKALSVPQEVIFQEGSKNFVYRVVSGKLSKTEVTLGISDDINQEITQGLKKGDRVVLNPTDKLYNGMPVSSDNGSEG